MKKFTIEQSDNLIFLLIFILIVIMNACTAQ